MQIANNVPLEPLDLPREETYYKATTPSLKVFAQPLSMPVDTSGVYRFQNVIDEAEQKSSFWQSLLTTTSNVIPMVSKIQQENKRVQTIEGWMSAATGKQLDENASKAMVKGYYQYTAELDFPVFNSAIQEYFQQNQMLWDTPEEAQSDLTNFVNQFMQARPTNDYYLETFLPHALDIQQNLINQWTEQRIQQINEEFIATSVAGVQNKTDGYIQAGLQKFLNVTNVDLLDSEFALDTLEITDEFKEFLRFGLSEIQKEAKTMNLSRLDVSQLYINRIGELAVAYGIPELLDFTDIADEDGIKLNQTVFSNTIQKYRTEAMKVKQAKIEQNLKAQEELDKQATDLLYKEWYFNIAQYVNASKFDPTVKAKFEEYYVNEILQNEYLAKLSDTRYNTIVNMANEILYNEHTYSQVSNERIIVELDKAFYEGTLNPEEVTYQLLNNNLSLKDYQAYMKKLQDKDELNKQQYQQWLQAKTIAKYEVYGISEDEWLKILNTQNWSPSAINAVTDVFLKQREAEAKTLEQVQKEQQAKEEALLASQRKQNYLKMRNYLQNNQFIAPETIIRMYANGELEATDADKLLSELYSVINDVEKFKTKNFDSMIKATIDMFAGSIYTVLWKGEVNAAMLEKANELSTKFYETNDLTRDDIHILFREQVLTPLVEYGNYITSSGELSQIVTPANTQKDVLQSEYERLQQESRGGLFDFAGKLFNRNKEPKNYVAPETTLTPLNDYTVQDIIDEYSLVGVSPIDARIAIHSETKAFIEERLKEGVDPSKLHIYLTTQKGFTDEEAMKLILEVVQSKGNELLQPTKPVEMLQQPKIQ